MVVVAQRVVDGVTVVLDGPELDGFYGLEHIYAAKTVGVTLAYGQRQGGLLKDAADIFGC